MRRGVQCQRGVREWPSEKDISASFQSGPRFPNSLRLTCGGARMFLRHTRLHSTWIYKQHAISDVKKKYKWITKLINSRVKAARALYVGETSRHLHARVSDCLGISALTGKKRKCLSPTAILSHHDDTGHPFSFDDFKIISSCYSESELLLRESLLTSKLKPSLNANMGSAPLFFVLIHLYCFYSNFLRSFNLPSVSVIFIFILSFYWLSLVLTFACHYVISVTVFVILSLKMLQALRQNV